MKQITEDYVSEEVAKLLQMKGFDEPCDSYYEWFESGVTLYKGYMPEFYHGRYKPVSDMLHLKRPTHQMALKWLREVHNLHIEIYRTACGYLYIISNIPYGTDLYNPEYGGDDENSGQWTTYEKCVEAAIKYTLENLI